MLLAFLPETSLMAAFLSGLLSGLSPAALAFCLYSLIYLIGMSLHDLTRTGEREAEHLTIVIHTLWFLAGFSGVFIGLSTSTTFIGSWLVHYQLSIRHAGAILIVIVGLYVTTIANPFFLAGNTRFHLSARSIRYTVSCAVGGTFAAAWTPYVGPALDAALSSLGNVGTMMDGFTLLTFYSMGFGIPLLVFSVILCRIAARFQWYSTKAALIAGLCGLLLILVGAALYADRLIDLAALLGRAGFGVSL